MREPKYHWKRNVHYVTVPYHYLVLYEKRKKIEFGDAQIHYVVNIKIEVYY